VFRRFPVSTVLGIGLLFGFASLSLAAVTPLRVLGGNAYRNLTTAATSVLKSSQGVLHSVCVNNPSGSDTVTIYDNTAASGTKIATLALTTSSPTGCYVYDATFNTGLTVVKSGTNDITVNYQ